MKTFLYYFKTSILSLKQQSDVILFHKRKKLIFFFGLIFIFLFQLIHVFKPSVPEEYSRTDASGFSHDYAENFIYFYYYLNLFPISTSYTPLTYSKEGAQQNIKEHGDSLLMEYKHWSRLGENARILLYLPNAYLKGSPKNPSIIPFNVIVFTTSLLIVYCAFWYYGLPLLGFFIALFFGSSPFLLYETYARNNIFALLAVNTLIILAINLPFFKMLPQKKHIWYLPVLSGTIIATAIHIRGENLVLLISCLFIYLTVSNFKIVLRLLLCVLCILSFVTVKIMWQKYFDQKFNEAHSIVSKAGGNPYNGDRYTSHTFWHPVFCGLGDYDTKYNYKWDDRVAYRYALPVLKEKYNMDLAYSGDYGLNEYYDSQKKYYKKLELFNEYDEVVKEKVLTDISNDPLWYLQILSKRIISVFKDTTPVWFKLWKIELKLPINGLFVIPFIFLFWSWKKWFELKLLLFSFPLAVTSIVIYSKGNTTFNSCFHLFFAALVAAWIVEFIFVRIKQRKKLSNTHA